MSDGHSYKPNLPVLAYYIDTDDPARRISIRETIGQIAEMDLDADRCTGHIAGLLAARLSLEYLDANQHAVSEKALDIGTLAMLGGYITERTPLTPTAMDYAERYQRVILFTRVLDDFEPEPAYATRAYSSIAQRVQERIRFNIYSYKNGRTEFSRTYADIVAEYKDFVSATQPTGSRIAMYRNDDAIAPVVERFLLTRRSLLGYVPELAAQEQKLWHYARAHYARYILPI
ncbi:MAG TPA: hypothetical protein VLF43_04565 [Candidatus Saccharimonadales bacterium]|nr:hypothetical protein [Candidatus Saccharimonadales bacterium]